MKSLFDPANNRELTDRLEKLSGKSQPLWGRMTVGQMLTHCQMPLRVALGDLQIKRSLMGILFGKWARNKFSKPGGFTKNLPTHPSFVIREDRPLAPEREKLQSLIRRFLETDPESIAQRKHPFFGKMTSAQWGAIQWNHLDHHFRQFGV